MGKFYFHVGKRSEVWIMLSFAIFICVFMQLCSVCKPTVKQSYGTLIYMYQYFTYVECSHFALCYIQRTSQMKTDLSKGIILQC